MTEEVKTEVHLRGERNILPSCRSGYIQKCKVGGESFYFSTGDYPNGKLGEIFIDSFKQGSEYRSLLQCFAVAISLGLQYGVPLEEFIDAFTFVKFEPAGMVQGHDNIKMCTSTIDLIFRDLGLKYLGREDLVQIKPKKHIVEKELESL